jgi:tRNA pseudouridine(55) synthase
MKTILLDKKLGQTPLQAIQEWKAANPEYADTPASYAGRLDPMAEGKLLILLGDECKKQDQYIGLDKEYEIEVLLGVASDTGDVLGMVHASASTNSASPTPDEIRAALDAEIGSHARKYPIFSSKTVNGKPLFLYALEGTIDSIKIPEHIETIHSIDLLEQTQLDASNLRSRIENMLALAPTSSEPSKVLGADFRIKEVHASWDAVFTHTCERALPILKLTVSCASGTYMRSLAARIGKALDTDALALSIRRTRIGAY